MNTKRTLCRRSVVAIAATLLAGFSAKAPAVTKQADPLTQTIRADMQRASIPGG